MKIRIRQPINNVQRLGSLALATASSLYHLVAAFVPVIISEGRGWIIPTCANASKPPMMSQLWGRQVLVPRRWKALNVR